MEYNQKERTKFVQINIICKPVKHQKMKINCSFSAQKHLAYRSTFNGSNKAKKRLAFSIIFQTIMVVKISMKDV